MKAGETLKLSIRGVILIASWLLLAGCEKARLDEQVRELCAKDGGIKVYETVTLPRERFDKYGEVPIPEKRLAKPSAEYFYVWDIHNIKSGSPSLKRNHFKLFRRSDEKLMGEGIGYVRSGGDLPGPWHESAFHCPDPSDYSIKFVAQRVFIQSKSAGTQQ